MNVGRDPTNWTLYAVPSLRDMPSSRAAASTSRWSAAASRSMAKGHSYGYETTGMRSWDRTFVHGAPRGESGASPSWAVVRTTWPASVSRGKNCVLLRRSQSSAARPDRPRSTFPS